METRLEQQVIAKQKRGKNNQNVSNEMTSVDFDLTKSGKSKNVSFAAAHSKGKGKGKKKQGSGSISDLSNRAVNEGVDDLKQQMDQMRAQAQAAQKTVDDGFAVEDSKLLEVLMEHILFHWEDIMACLVDELIEEEVLELNNIEKRRSGLDPEQQAREDLIDMLFEKKRNITLDAPDLGFKWTKEI